MNEENRELGRRFGERLVELRDATDISQEELGFRAGLHRTEIGRLERGTRIPGLATLLKLAGALAVSMDELTKGMAWTAGRFEPGRFELGKRERASDER